MAYWKTLAKRALLEALKDSKLDSEVDAMIALLAQAVISLILWFALGAYTDATLATRALAAATPFLTFPVAFVIRAVLAPKATDQQLRTEQATELETQKERQTALTGEIERLKNVPMPAHFEDGLYQEGKLVGIVFGASVDGELAQFSEVHNGLFDQSKPFLFRDFVLRMKSYRNYIACSTSVTVTDKGPIRSDDPA
jgi:hypothetical protein